MTRIATTESPATGSHGSTPEFGAGAATLETAGSRPLISVVITNFNYADFVGDAIRSVLTQDYGNVECIVVDDGSTDGSVEIIGTFGSVTMIRQSNGGQAAAARAGLAAAAGDVVVFLDADDLLLPQACTEVARHWSPGVAVVLYRLAVTVRGGEPGALLPDRPFVTREARAHVRRFGYLPAAPMSGNAFAASVARRIFERALGFDKNGVDAWLGVCAPLLGEVRAIDRPLGIYRVHDRNVSLAGRRTLRRTKARIYYQYWAQRTAAMLGDEPPLPRSWTFLRGPDDLKWYVLTCQIPDPGFDIPVRPVRACVVECCREFLTFPHIRWRRRLWNCALVVGVGLLPAGLRTLAVRFVYRFDV